MATRGSYVHNYMVEFSGAFRKLMVSEIQTKRYTGLLELKNSIDKTH